MGHWVKKHKEIDLVTLSHSWCSSSIHIACQREKKSHYFLAVLKANVASAEVHESVVCNIRLRALAFIIRELEKSGVIKLLIHTSMDQSD